MNFEEFHKHLAAAPLCFRDKLRCYLRNPTERSACYIAGYVAALGDAQLFKTEDAARYWPILISRTEGNGALGCDLIAEMDNLPEASAMHEQAEIEVPDELLRKQKAVKHWNKQADDVDRRAALGLMDTDVAKELADCYRRTARALQHDIDSLVVALAKENSDRRTGNE